MMTLHLICIHIDFFFITDDLVSLRNKKQVDETPDESLKMAANMKIVRLSPIYCLYEMLGCDFVESRAILVSQLTVCCSLL